ncbi:MAG: EF-hand domain-containing protein [Rhodoferax sp.]|nr:EF-hand domain-containing protein [Rhodoferax sp.]
MDASDLIATPARPASATAQSGRGFRFFVHLFTFMIGETMRRISVFVMTSVMIGAIFSFVSFAQAQTIVPNLDETGARGDIARKMKDKSVAEFDAADTDKDGKLSREEVDKAKAFNYFSANFDKHDRNKDGFLDWNEFVGHNRWPK